MSLTSALSNANSGLSAATRSAQLVSSNVANALTEGYGRREINLSAAQVGGTGAGVRVSGIERVVNQVAINERRIADAALGFAQQDATFFASLNSELGSPEDVGSLTGRIAAFEAALVSASATPESVSALGSAINAAGNIVRSFNSASDMVQSARLSADQSIHAQVQHINRNLSAIESLNDQIRTQSVSGFDVSALFDQRQQLIDEISDKIPLKELPRDHGRVALMTSNGTILVEDTAAQLEFTPTALIVPDMTVQSNALSGLTISGSATMSGTALDAINGGSLSAAFKLRDETAVSAQASLDGLARDLIQRTSDPSVDPTLAGGAGIFTDDGLAFDPLNEVGLSSRLSLSAAVDPNAGGDVWRLRDGIGAASPGPVGDNTILTSLGEALSQSQSGATIPPFSSVVGQYQSTVSVQEFQANNAVAFSTAQVNAFGDAERSFGVDTDQEMQKLLVIEQSYAANAKVIETIDQMMQSLLRI